MTDSIKPPKLVRELMTVGVPTCPMDTPVVDVVRKLLEQDWEGMCVLDEEGHAVGVISREDLVAAYAHGRIKDNTTACDIMDERVVELPPDIPLTAAAQMMRDEGVRVVFLMHNANGIIYPAAYLSYRHFLRQMAAENTEDLRDLGIAAERRSPIDVFIEKREAAKRRASSDE